MPRGDEFNENAGAMLLKKGTGKEWISCQLSEQQEAQALLDGHYPIGLARWPAKMTRGLMRRAATINNEDWPTMDFGAANGQTKAGKSPPGPPRARVVGRPFVGRRAPKGGKWAAMAPRADDEGRKEDSRQQNWQLAPKKCCRFLTVPFCRVEGNKERTAQETSWQRVLRTTFRPSSLLPSCCLLYSQPPIVVPLAAAD